LYSIRHDANRIASRARRGGLAAGWPAPTQGNTMNRTIGEFRVGEDLAVALDAVAGEVANVTEIAARMKPAAFAGNRLALDHDAAGIPLDVAVRGTDGWTLSLSANATAALPPGLYGIDARLAFSGGIEITEQTAFVALSQAAIA
jgi:hypothetical protein